jgi:hypothetical protein
MAPKLEDLWYTRPKPGRTPSIHSTNSSQFSGRTSSSAGIPDGLQLQLVLDGRTCPPCSARDFDVSYTHGVISNLSQEYLDRVEHSGENLAFYLWFKGLFPLSRHVLTYRLQKAILRNAS